MGYKALRMLDSFWGIYRKNEDGTHKLVASGLSEQSAKSITHKACNSSMLFDKAAVIRCAGIWH